MSHLTSWRDGRGQAVSARTSGPLVQRAPRAPDAIDICALGHTERWLATAPLSALVLEHADLCRWLNTPHAELWADQYREKSARIRVVWQTIKRRFPEHALKHGGAA